MPKENVVLVICALKKEYEALKNKVREGKDEEIAGIKGIMFPIPSGKAFAFQGRVGKVNTALNKVAYHDVDLTAFGNPLGQMDKEPLWFETDNEVIESVKELENNIDFNIKVGPIISGDKFVTKKNLSKKIIKYFGKPLVVDMESGSVAQCAHELNVPFAIIRSISDDTSNSSNQNMYEEFLELAAKHASSVTLWLLNSIK